MYFNPNHNVSLTFKNHDLSLILAKSYFCLKLTNLQPYLTVALSHHKTDLFFQFVMVLEGTDTRPANTTIRSESTSMCPSKEKSQTYLVFNLDDLIDFDLKYVTHIV